MTDLEILGVDPRANSKSKLTPPEPLPHVSRRALARVRDRVVAPSGCPYCGECVGLVSNAEIYHGREFGKWPYVYLCSGCRAYVGLHPDTDLPLGTLADRGTRDGRKHAKFLFKTIMYERFGGDRSAAYQWLAKSLGISSQACHFGFFDVAQCNRAARVIREALYSKRVTS